MPIISVFPAPPKHFYPPNISPNTAKARSCSIYTGLDAMGLLLPHISIASNTLTFDEAGICSGIDHETIIHPLSKDEWDVPASTRETFVGRDSILLFGDSLDDIRMVETSLRDTTVAVGFCTSSRGHQREQFRETFDIVVESDDGDDGVVEYLLGEIARS